MKKLAKVLTLSLMALLCNNLFSEETKQEPKELSDWTSFQLGFFPGAPSATNYSNVYGLKLGAPMVAGHGRIYGIEPSVLYSGTNYVQGIQATILGACISRQVYGMQAAWFGFAMSDKVNGFQGSIGAAVSGKLSGFQASLANVTTEKSFGCQGSVVNIATNFKGFQAAAVNIASDTLEGVQLGVVNYSDHKGCQFGLVNIIKDGFLPFMIIFNVSF